MVDFEGALRVLSEQGKAAVCVPAAFKDVGLHVPQEMFMDPLIIAQELGLTPVDIQNLNLQRLYAQYQQFKKDGYYSFIRIGAPTQVGVLGQHLNSITGTALLEKAGAFVLGGIPPFGKEKGNVFSVPVLKKLVPMKDGILVFKKG